jgi:hypothetical protein
VVTPRIQKQEKNDLLSSINVNSTTTTGNSLMPESIIENVIDEEEEIMKSNVKIQKRLPKHGYKNNIIERQFIPTIYGDQALETLIIDDVRRSALLNIEGETHINKNEIIIEGERNENKFNRCE